MATHQLAHGLASLGRHGDSMLVHMQPQEVAGLQQLAQAHGTSLTINPHTGMPEAFSLGGLFRAIIPTAVGMMVPGSWGAMAPLMAGAVTGAGLAAATGENPLMGGLMGGLGGWSGADLAKGFTAAGTPVAADTIKNTAASTAGGAGEVGMFTASPNLGATGATSFGNTTANIGMANSFPSSMGGSGPQISLGGGGYDVVANAPKSFSDTASTIGSGIKNVVTGQPGAWEAAKAAVPNFGTKLAMTGATGALGGLEPTDLYGEPLKSDKDKYDPYAKLNLGNDTGLRLYAVGGSITSNPSVGGGISDLYNRPEGQTTETISNDGYGVGRLNSLSYEQAKEQAKTYGYAHGGYLDGAGDGMSDSIPATIEGKQPARLADGEFVVPADVVSHLGNGSSKAGSQRLYSMLDKVRKARTGHAKQGRQINPNKYLPA